MPLLRVLAPSPPDVDPGPDPEPGVFAEPTAANTGPTNEGALVTMSSADAINSIIDQLRAGVPATLTGKHIEGFLNIDSARANGQAGGYTLPITIEDCLFEARPDTTASYFFTVNATGVAWANRLTLRRVRTASPNYLPGPAPGGGEGQGLARSSVIYGRSWEAEWCDLTGAVDLVKAQGDVRLAHSYVHDPLHPDGAHADVVQIRQGFDILVEWCSLWGLCDVRSPSSAGQPSNGVTQFGSAIGDMDRVYIVDNWAEGGGYTFRGPGSDWSPYVMGSDILLARNKLGPTYRSGPMFSWPAEFYPADGPDSNVWGFTGQKQRWESGVGFVDDGAVTAGDIVPRG